jgi:glycosyltransferase involved in cell wall biosynthesis
MRIAIVTISYNQAAFLQECIDSIACQRRDSDEYIVVDPGSTDGSRELIERNTARIDHIVVEPDEGPADGLNKGFAASSAEILGYINADDRLAPGALAFVREFFSRNADIDVLCGAIRIIDGSGAISLRKRTSDRFDVRRYAAGICTVGQQATFFRRRTFEAAGGFNRANRICWDGELLVDMALSGARFATVSRVLGDFRIYSQSITGSGKFTASLYQEHGRIAAKIASSGVRLYSKRGVLMRRLLYRFDPMRHLGYLLAS